MTEWRPPWCSRAVARFEGIRKSTGNRWRYGEDKTSARSAGPSRLTDVVVALLLAVADALALAGIALIMVLAGLASTGDGLSGTQRPHPGVSFSGLALAWAIPAALAVSTFVHARLRMPIAATVQGLFLIVGIVLALAETNMLLSIA